ncbi:MAG: hypothetical protein Q4Q03_07175, partial [Bowdeniella nasicola]|nr:hypothetical protein [Bowdeniella nasicola]
LAAGADQLVGGQKQLASGTAKLAAGQEDLAQGAAQLAAGTAEIRTQLGQLPPEVLALLQGDVDLAALDELLATIEPLPEQIDALIDPDQAAAQLHELLVALNDARPQIQFAADQAQAAAVQLQKVADLLASFAGGELAGDLAGLRDGLLALADGRLGELAAACPSSGASDEFCAQLRAEVDNLRAFASSPQMQDLLARLTDYVAQIDGGSQMLLAILNGDGTAENPGLIAVLNQIADRLIGPDGNSGVLGDLTAIITTLQDTVDSLGGPDGVIAALAKLRAVIVGVGDSDGIIPMLRKALPQLPVFYEGLLALDDGTHQLAVGSAQSAAGSRELAGGANQLVRGSQALASGSHVAANGLRALVAGSNELAGGAHQLHTGANQAAAGSGELAAGLDELHDGSVTLHDGTMSLADALTEAADEVPRYSDAQQEQMAAMGAKPVNVVDSQLHTLIGNAAQTYPSFAPLMLWLGAIATFLVLPALPRTVRTAAMSTSGATWRGYLPAAAIGAGQGLLVALLLWLWDITPTNPVASVAMLVLIGVVFAAIIQMLHVIAGARMGSVIALLLFVLQAVLLGGLIPLQTAPEMVQSLWNILPVGAGIRGVQATVLPGIGAMLPSALLLLGWALVALVATNVSTGRRQTITPSELRSQLRVQAELV